MMVLDFHHNHNGALHLLRFFLNTILIIIMLTIISWQSIIIINDREYTYAEYKASIIYYHLRQSSP